ncbi:MAG: hypothetical protein MJ223_00995 [Mycoplasmoidaceae bacterium]|nr:hypothetical protein [Mycoplasmoidaceae bacterium]
MSGAQPEIGSILDFLSQTLDWAIERLKGINCHGSETNSPNDLPDFIKEE